MISTGLYQIYFLPLPVNIFCFELLLKPILVAVLILECENASLF